MNGLTMLLTITKRDLGEQFIRYYKRMGMECVTETLVSGTATQSVLDILGIENTEKVELLSFVHAKDATRVLHGLIHDMQIDLPGKGIACTIPTGSIGGMSSLRFLVGDRDQIISEVNPMSEFKYALITAVVESGTTELVMDAAKGAGAGGGTVIRAKTAGNDAANRFFGVSIAAEKEIVQIVARDRDKDAIMRAIMAKAGADSPARGAVFSIPVENVVGLRSLLDDDIYG